MAALRRWFGVLRPGGHLVLVEGRWGDPVGTRPMPWWGGVPAGVACRPGCWSTRCVPLAARVHMEQLPDPILWGKQVEAERYVVLAHV